MIDKETILARLENYFIDRQIKSGMARKSYRGLEIGKNLLLKKEGNCWYLVTKLFHICLASGGENYTLSKFWESLDLTALDEKASKPRFWEEFNEIL